MRNKQLSNTFVVGGVLTSYNDIGVGQVLLFVHGWMDAKETFDPLIAQLSKHYRCVAVDLPNFGQTEKSNEITRIEDYVTFIQEFVTKLKLSDFVYIGHSMGGQIGIQAIGESVLLPTQLILIASAGVRNNYNLLKIVVRYASKFLKHIVPRRIKELFYKKIESDYSQKLSPIHKKIIASVLTSDIQESAKKISVSTLLIYGDADRHTPLWMGEKLHNLINGSKLTVLKGADHWAHKSSAKEVTARIGQFLND